MRILNNRCVPGGLSLSPAPRVPSEAGVQCPLPALHGCSAEAALHADWAMMSIAFRAVPCICCSHAENVLALLMRSLQIIFSRACPPCLHKWEDEAPSMFHNQARSIMWSSACYSGGEKRH